MGVSLYHPISVGFFPLINQPFGSSPHGNLGPPQVEVSEGTARQGTAQQFYIGDEAGHRVTQVVREVSSVKQQAPLLVDDSLGDEWVDDFLPFIVIGDHNT